MVSIEASSRLLWSGATGSRSTSTPKTAAKCALVRGCHDRRHTPRPIAPGVCRRRIPMPEASSIVIARNGLRSSRPSSTSSRNAVSSSTDLETRPRSLLSSLDAALPNRNRFHVRRCRRATRVQGFLSKPPAFDPSKKYPVLMLPSFGRPANSVERRLELLAGCADVRLARLRSSS